MFLHSAVSDTFQDGDSPHSHFNLSTFLTVLFICKDVTGKRDSDAFPIEEHESFKMVYLNKNVKIFRNNTQILLAVQQIHTKESFLS